MLGTPERRRVPRAPEQLARARPKPSWNQFQ
jgi:hypothetical protein